MNTPSSSRDQSDTPAAAHFGAGNIGFGALIPTIICTVFATTAVALRWYTRCMVSRCVGLDDYVILLSLALAWVICILVGLCVAEGIGDYNGPRSTAQITKLILANNTTWTILINVTKASILAQYLRFLHTRHTRLLCYILLYSLIPAVCWGTFGGIFLCSPTAKLWNPALDGHCRDPEVYWLSVASVDILLDFAVLILPMPSIAGLHLPKRQKVATMLVFLLGFLVCVISVVRMATVLIASRQGHYVKSGVWAVTWSAVEANVGIICACLLSLKALITKLFPRLLSEEELNPRHMRIASVPAEWRPGDSHAPTMSHSRASHGTVETLASNVKQLLEQPLSGRSSHEV